MKKVRGYKVFNPDWTCKDKQYICPGYFEENVTLVVCSQGMHFCKKAADCFNYYSFNPENKVAEVIAYGMVVEKGDKCCTDKLEIVREISWQELLETVNTGKGCTGRCNSGNCNSGNCNSGNWNSGDCNSGNRNSGNRNSGNWNSGNCNSGNWNSGNRNSGNCNSGDCNSGNRNSGNRNSGDCNSGNWNSGNRNSGDRNSGNCNSGNCNSGDWNSGDFSNGCFNTESPKMYMFNRLSEWTYRDWLNSEACYIMNQFSSNALEYVCLTDMTDEEKATHPEAEITSGYLKTINRKNMQESWDNLPYDEKETIKAIPNFDKEIFKKITGIDVEKEN